MGIRSNGKTKVYVWTVILAMSSLLFFTNQAKAALPDGLILSYGINQSFNGTSEYVDKTTDIASVAGLTQGSIVGKFKSSSTANAKTILSASDTLDPSSNISLTVNNGTVYFENRENNVYATQLSGQGSFNDGNWHTAVITVDGSGTKMYVDGALNASSPSAKFFANVTGINGMWVGRNADNGGGQWYFSGDISFVNVYSKALSPSEVLSISSDSLIPPSQMTASASSFQTGNEPAKALDGSASTIWHTLWNGSDTTREITLDLGQAFSTSKLTYLPRQDAGSGNGTITSYEIYTSADGIQYTQAARGIWTNDRTLKTAVFTVPNVRYVKLKGVAGVGGFASAAEISVYVLGGSNNTAPAPTGLSAVPVSSSQVYVTWDASAAAARYDLEIDGNVISSTANSYTQSGLSAGSAHTYRVRAVNGAAAGAWSLPVTTTTFTGNQYKSPPVALLGKGIADANSYRIPSLLTTINQTVILGFDQRIPNDNDAPYDINAGIKRSTDGGHTFGPMQIVADYPGTLTDGSSSIDPSMLQDEATGTLFMMFDHFPGAIGALNSAAGTGFDANGYKLVYDNSNAAYTIRANGNVYNSTGVQTPYNIRSNGDVYNGSTYSGNIYLKQGIKPEIFHETKTSFLQYIKSDDDGVTWSEPVDINFQVKAPNMKFLGTGPSKGMQIKKGPHAGRLLFPVYYTTTANGLLTTAVVYSDDHGQTWTRSASPASSSSISEAAIVEYGNGNLRMFMRHGGKVHVSISEDGGATWSAALADNALIDSNCQLTAINYPDLGDGKDRVILANPASTTRANGTVRLSEDGGATWKYSKVITTGTYAYSSLTVLPNGNIGLAYEDTIINSAGKRITGNTYYTEFNLDWMMTP